MLIPESTCKNRKNFQLDRVLTQALAGTVRFRTPHLYILRDAGLMGWQRREANPCLLAQGEVSSDEDMPPEAPAMEQGVGLLAVQHGVAGQGVLEHFEQEQVRMCALQAQARSCARGGPTLP